MNKEIIFRGIPIDEDCEWDMITGSLVVDIDGNTTIYHPLKTSLGGFRIVPVKPESVTQFTGLVDKNGVKIFVGDILVNDSNERLIINSNWFLESFNAEEYFVIGNEIY